MGLPLENDNLKKYKSSSILNKVKKLIKKQYMLIHGTADDNVHYQQSLLFSRELVEKNVLFDQFFYTDEVHSLSNVKIHRLNNMDIFWSKCFGYVPAYVPKANNMNVTSID